MSCLVQFSMSHNGISSQHETRPPVSSYISFTAFTLRHNISILIIVAFTLNLLAIFQGFAARPCFPDDIAGAVEP